MKKHSPKKTAIIWQLIPVLVAVGLSLVWIVPALADYLGPNRTRTETVSVVDHCDWTLYNPAPPSFCSTVYLCTLTVPSCEYPSIIQQSYWCCYRNWAMAEGPFKWIATSSWVQTFYREEERIVTYPPATVNGLLQCTIFGNDSWCTSPARVAFQGGEPVSGHVIYALEGTWNGEPFYCLGDSCSLVLTEGENNLNYWALSTWGDSSTMGLTNVKVDSRAPVITGEVSGTGGSPNWFVSAVILSASAVDSLPGSGLRSLEYSLDSGPWLTYNDPISMNDGIHTIDLRATDNAGNVGSFSTRVNVDTESPYSSFTSAVPASGWLRGNFPLEGTSIDQNSDIAVVELSLDGGGQWQSLPGTHAWTYLWDTTEVPDGTYKVLARATDFAGNVEHTASLEVRVDNTPPEVAVSVPGELCRSCGDIAIGLLAKDDGSGISDWIFTLDGATVLGSGESSVEHSILWNGASLALGAHVFTLQAWDVAGNTRELAIPFNLVQGVVDPPVIPTRVPRPTGTRTPVPTRILQTQTATVMRVIFFPTSTSTRTQNPSRIPQSDSVIFLPTHSAGGSGNPVGSKFDGMIIGFFIVAALLAGGAAAVNELGKSRSWEFEYQLATQGLGGEFWLPTPPGMEIIYGPSELNNNAITYLIDENGVPVSVDGKRQIDILHSIRINDNINQYINVNWLLREKYPNNTFSTTDFNLCGLIAVAAILGASLEEVLLSFAENVKGGEEILTKPRGTTSQELIDVYQSFGWQAEKRQAGNWQTQSPSNYGAPNWQELANLLNTGHGITALVRLNTFQGCLSPAGVWGAGHWVDVLEIINGQAGTFVRVYNPYKNREETYAWRDFVNSWNNVDDPRFEDTDSRESEIPYYTAVISKPSIPLNNRPAAPRRFIPGRLITGIRQSNTQRKWI